MVCFLENIRIPLYCLILKFLVPQSIYTQIQTLTSKKIKSQKVEKCALLTFLTTVLEHSTRLCSWQTIRRKSATIIKLDFSTPLLQFHGFLVTCPSSRTSEYMDRTLKLSNTQYGGLKNPYSFTDTQYVLEFFYEIIFLCI